MTRNEERDLPGCLASLERFAEAFVVDSNSTDGTREVAERLGARVATFTWDGKYPKKKQWCLDNLRFDHDWVLYVDADEQVTPPLADEIAALMERGPEHGGYFAGLDYVFLGRVLTHGQLVYKLVLLDRRKAHFVDYDDLDAVNMWEVEGHYQPRIDGTTGVLAGRILHADHDELYDYFARHNRYSDWEAVLLRKGKLVGAEEAQPGLRRIAKKVFNALPFKPLAFFLYSYVFKLGFLDGRAGYHYALAKSFYYWQVGIKTRELELRGR